MSNAYLSWVNHVDAGVLTTDSEVSGLGVDKLTIPIVQSVWRSNATTSPYVQVDFGADKLIDVLALVQPRSGLLLAATDRVRHRLDADGGTPGTGAVLDTGGSASDVAPGYGYHVYRTSSTLTARYWRFDINAPSLIANNYVQVGRAWAGSILEPAVGIQFGAGRAWSDTGQSVRAAKSGARYSDAGARLRQWDFQFGFLADTEAQEVEEMQRIAGTTMQVLIVRTTAEMPVGRRAVLGQMTAINPIRQPSFALSSVAFSITEDQ